MNIYTIIAGVNGTGKTSLRGVLEGQGLILGRIIDADYIAKQNNGNVISAGKQAVQIINDCLDKNISFTQETTLSGHMTLRTVKIARKKGYYVRMFYIGLNSEDESLKRIENRVRKGGHNIPVEDVHRRYTTRFESLKTVIPYCDEVIFYDNENGFIKAAEIKNAVFHYTNGYRPLWLSELYSILKSESVCISF
ncbi:MAG: zeta toxin family protein [Acutalibacteraceae bacterium]